MSKYEKELRDRLRNNTGFVSVEGPEHPSEHISFAETLVPYAKSEVLGKDIVEKIKQFFTQAGVKPDNAIGSVPLLRSDITAETVKQITPNNNKQSQNNIDIGNNAI